MAHVKNRAISVKAKLYLEGVEIKEIILRDGHISSKKFKYFVSKDGKVYQYNIKNNKFKEMYYHIAHGYRRVRIKDIITNKRKYYRVSRLVAEAFIPKPKEEYNIVNHIDGNKLNDEVSNLEWCTISMNTQHAYDNNLIKDRGGWISTPYHKRLKNTAC